MLAAPRQSAAGGLGVCCRTAKCSSWFEGEVGLLLHVNQLQLVWGLLQHSNQLQLVWGFAAARQSAAVGLGVCCSAHGKMLQLLWGPAAARQNAAVGLRGRGACCSTAISCSWFGVCCSTAISCSWFGTLGRCWCTIRPTMSNKRSMQANRAHKHVRCTLIGKRKNERPFPCHSGS